MDGIHLVYYQLDHFVHFICHKLVRGRLHDYNNQQPLQDTLGMSIKSWIGARPCFVKIKSDVETITSFSVSNDLTCFRINIKWNCKEFKLC